MVTEWDVEGTEFVPPVGQIDYLTHDPSPEYQRELDEAAANGLEALRLLALRWRTLAYDGYVTVSDMNEETFAEFKKGLENERRGEFSGQEWVRKFSCVVIPAPLLAVTMMGDHFGVPWGCAWIQMRRAGCLKPAGDVWHVVRPLLGEARA